MGLTTEPPKPPSVAPPSRPKSKQRLVKLCYESTTDGSRGEEPPSYAGSRYYVEDDDGHFHKFKTMDLLQYTQQIPGYWVWLQRTGRAVWRQGKRRRQRRRQQLRSIEPQFDVLKPIEPHPDELPHWVETVLRFVRQSTASLRLPCLFPSSASSAYAFVLGSSLACNLATSTPRCSTAWLHQMYIVWREKEPRFWLDHG